MAIVKNNDLLSKYWLKAYSRAARYFSNMCNKMESHLFSKDTRLNQYIHFEMLLYIHTQTTTYIYRTSKTNKQANSKMLTAWHFRLTHTSPRLCRAMPLTFPPQDFSAPSSNT